MVLGFCDLNKINFHCVYFVYNEDLVCNNFKSIHFFVDFYLDVSMFLY